MSKWSSFEQDQEYTNTWRQHLESEELDEGVWDKAKGKWDKAAAKAAKIKGGAQKAGAGAEKARQAATGAYDWIANFLSGSPKDKDYSHLNMPAPDPTAKGAEPEGEESAEEDAAAAQKKREEDEAWEQHRGAPGAGEQQKTDGAQEEEPKDKKKTISRVPDSALNESQAYDRWKVLSGIKKKVI